MHRQSRRSPRSSSITICSTPISRPRRDCCAARPKRGFSRFWPYAAGRRTAVRSRVDAPRRRRRRLRRLQRPDVADAGARRGGRCSTPIRSPGADACWTSAAAKALSSRPSRSARRSSTLKLFDLPPVAARARASSRRSDCPDRVEAIGGDMLQRSAAARRRRHLAGSRAARPRRRIGAGHCCAPSVTPCRAAASLLVAEPMAGERGAEPMGDAYFGFYLLAMGRGRPRTSGGDRRPVAARPDLLACTSPEDATTRCWSAQSIARPSVNFT